MSTDKVKEALERQKIGGAETDYIEVIARALEVRPALIRRVLYAFHALDDKLRDLGLGPFFRRAFPAETWEESLPDAELRAAIRFAMAAGVTRVVLARAILAGQEVALAVESLLPKERAAELCNGCPERLECVAESLSTPQECYLGRKKDLAVTPIKMTRRHVEVEARQPAGRYCVPLAEVKLRHER